MNNKPTLTICVGLPMSGLEEWCIKTGFPVVSPDALRQVIHGQAFRKNAEPLIWSFAKTMVGALFEAGHTEVVVEAPLWSRPHRNQWIDTRWNLRAVYFPTHKDECVKRAKENGRNDLVSIINRMSDTFDAPSARDESFLSVETIQ